MSLERAILDRDFAAAQAALRDGADVDLRGAEGFPPLMLASALGQPRMMELLLSAGADPLAVERRMGATALHKAAQSGNAEAIGLLLDHGAFVDQQSPVLGNTPLIDAVLHKHEAAVRVLLTRCARTTIRNHWGQSALELAREDESEGIVNAIEGKDAADAGRIADLTLFAAIETGDGTEVERLIQLGADVDQRLPVTGSVEDDYTPLGLAVRRRMAGVVGMLLEAGADPRLAIGLMQGTAVHEAAFLGFADVLRVLLTWGGQGAYSAVALGAQGPYNGLTALHDAVWHGHLETAEVLVEAGAPLSLRTHAGLTARELALAYGYDGIVKMLAEAEEA